MAKRGADADSEGPSAKMKREDPDDGGSGRTGRVRKKSAKVLEMEEFEQVEKTHHAGKKTKTPKPGTFQKASMLDEDDPSAEIAAPVITTPKLKMKSPKAPVGTPKSNLATNLMQAPIAVAPASAKNAKPGSAVKAQALGARLNKHVPQFVPVQSSGILTTSVKAGESATDMLAAAIKKEIKETNDGSDDSVKAEQPQSVIKYLLSSPSSGSKSFAGSTESGTELVGGGGKKSASKKAKLVQEKVGSSGKTVKPKSAKKLDPSASVKEEEYDEDTYAAPAATAGLKMRISASSDPQSAQVTLNVNSETPGMPEKGKKGSKKIKMEPLELASAIKADPDNLSSPTSKKSGKKVSKKKEKLIQDAISAAKQIPGLASLEFESGKNLKKKKKVKVSDESSLGELSQPDLYIDDAGEEESNLVIAETEKKKKKTLKKKKSSLKDKGLSSDSKVEEEKSDKKLSKRAPTAYMLFCNTHRPGIVNHNPGIEFAGISRKLGEMWQTLSTKQKLQWRRKAQRRMKRGSHLISTGKAAKDAAPQISTLSITQSAAGSTPASGSGQWASGNAAAVRYINMANRSPVETPQSPTKLNFSIEPVDVAAHLKLLGESLSIIGMRLQEHKGMIAVQGSLSVLLDSLLCACGPLLCLTQQVPDMDGCDPLVHGQTLDSVAYVMPGL
ncbi:hmg box-containing protein 4 [Plakobranchus ocellatus]|uniref:Hmg box-containing protein 4 n=1 Tax=Plakobranchus ocellatus TaxID=259542 RepID=A0AAV4DBL6_9GAST|nr:hmg box-containing protein 4 [Plakobranchus ocellatus]